MKWLIPVLVAFSLIACEKQGTMERAGEEIDEAVEDVKAGGETTGNKLDDKFDKLTKDMEDGAERVK